MSGLRDISPLATDQEAAALVAAVERFLADTAVAVASTDLTARGWLRAALHEGVGSSDEQALW